MEFLVSGPAQGQVRLQPATIVYKRTRASRTDARTARGSCGASSSHDRGAGVLRMRPRLLPFAPTQEGARGATPIAVGLPVVAETRWRRRRAKGRVTVVSPKGARVGIIGESGGVSMWIAIAPQPWCV